MRGWAWWLCFALPCAAIAGEPAPSPDEPPPLPRPNALAPKVQNVGIAGIMRDRLEGHTTASGEIYNRNALAAAHRSLPFGTTVRVTNVKNQRTVTVRINDRGAAAGNHIIDLTPRAAALVGLHGISVGEVKLEVLGAGRQAAPPATEPTLPVK